MKKTQPSEEQLKYASVLQAVSLSGLGILLVGFLVYLSGLLPTVIPVNQIPQYWNLRVHEFIEKTGAPTGWSWISLLDHGDVVSFIGVVFLAAGSLICFCIILPSFLKKKDIPFSLIIFIQVIILLLAASGIITGGD